MLQVLDVNQFIFITMLQARPYYLPILQVTKLRHRMKQCVHSHSWFTGDVGVEHRQALSSVLLTTLQSCLSLASVLRENQGEERAGIGRPPTWSGEGLSDFRCVFMAYSTDHCLLTYNVFCLIGQRLFA